MRIVLSLMLLLTVVIVGAAYGSVNFQVWVSDPLVKIFQTTAQPTSSPSQIKVTAVRNEYESAQIVATATADITALTVSVSAISGPSGTKPVVTTNFVGYVPVEHGTTYTPDDHLIATSPNNFPDPLLESTSVAVTSGQNQPIWFTIKVPNTTPPGTYTGTVTVTGDGESISVPLSITVSPVILPTKQSLTVTNWFSYENLENSSYGHGCPMWSESWWNMVATYADFMARYRINVAYARTNKLIVGHYDSSGNLTFDFSRFDRFVGIFQNAFQKYGLNLVIEGGHICGKSWGAANFMVWYPRIYNASGTDVTPSNSGSIVATSDQARSFYSLYLPAIQQHLIDKGWIDSYIQHIGDEPQDNSAESYKGVGAMVRQYAPLLKTVDAIQTKDLVGAINYWVPLPSFYIDSDNVSFFIQRNRTSGEQVWLYTCNVPKGEYMNRYLDYPLLDVRLMHWQNYKYGLPGYLHWGFNYWHGDSFTNIEANYGSTTSAFDPPGDTHIVYKGSKGPLSSIRLEAMRDGIEDYVLLKLLEKKDSKKPLQLCYQLIKSMTNFTHDPATFRTVRAQLLSALDENPVSVTNAKTLTTGTQMFIRNGIITADLRYPYSNLNMFYVESSDRTTGIGATTSGTAAYTPGQIVDMYGKTCLLDGTELIFEPDTVATYSGGDALQPLAMTNKASGGKAFGGQPAVIDNASDQSNPISSTGVNSIGKLVKMWGTVTGSLQTSLGLVFWINDGSDLRDGFQITENTPAVGVGVLAPLGISTPPTGLVCVTGILRVIPNPSDQPARLLVPRNSSDIISL